MQFQSLIVNSSGELRHHAYLIEGDRTKVLLELFEFFEAELSVTVKGNPDILHLTFDSFGIDEGRRVKEYQTSKSIIGKRRFFVIDTTSFTGEAQNSLLKVFEDPTPDTHFFIVVPSADVVLPTLRSRFLLIEHPTKNKITTRERIGAISAEHFIAESKAGRLKMLQGIIEEKDKGAAIELLNELEKLLHIKLVSQGEKGGVATTLTEIATLRQYLHDRSSSTKLIVEHLALVIPRY